VRASVICVEHRRKSPNDSRDVGFRLRQWLHNNTPVIKTRPIPPSLVLGHGLRASRARRAPRARTSGFAAMVVSSKPGAVRHRGSAGNLHQGAPRPRHARRPGPARRQGAPVPRRKGDPVAPGPGGRAARRGVTVGRRSTTRTLPSQAAEARRVRPCGREGSVDGDLGPRDHVAPAAPGPGRRRVAEAGWSGSLEPLGQGRASAEERGAGGRAHVAGVAAQPPCSPPVSRVPDSRTVPVPSLLLKSVCPCGAKDHRVNGLSVWPASVRSLGRLNQVGAPGPGDPAARRGQVTTVGGKAR